MIPFGLERIVKHKLSFPDYKRWVNKEIEQKFNIVIDNDDKVLTWGKTCDDSLKEGEVILIEDLIYNELLKLRKEQEENERLKKHGYTIDKITGKKKERKNSRKFKYVYSKPTPGESQLDRAKRINDAYVCKDVFYKLENNVTPEWIVENIFTKQCVYCGCDNWRKLGCDRIDNSKGHTMENCVPACRECNMDRASIPYDVYITIRKREGSFGKVIPPKP